MTALLQRHPESQQVLGFLPVAAFTDPYRQELFHAIRSLHAARRPVDPLTVDWELARRGTVASGDTESYVTRLARADTGRDSPVKTAIILLARLHRRASRAHVHGAQMFPQTAQLRISGLSHSTAHLQLVQPPPGTIAPSVGREPRN